MPENPSVRQARFLLSKGSPLSKGEKKTFLGEVRDKLRGKKLRKAKS